MGMVHPVLGSIRSKSRGTVGPIVVIRLEKNCQARLGDDGVGRFEPDMKAGDACFYVRKAIRSQELLHREMSKLYNTRLPDSGMIVVVAIDNDN